MKKILLVHIALLFSSYSFAQERYDGEPVDETFMMSIGGLYSNTYETVIRVDSLTLGLGSVINLEDNLNVDRSVSVVKLQGFYRFNPRHRIEWNYMSTNRTGYSKINNEIQIGEDVYAVGSQLNSKFRSNILKMDWSYSFINVKKYEAYYGFGLNIRKASIKLEGRAEVNGALEGKELSVSVSEYLPLPTFNIGFRYNYTDKLSINYNAKIFSISYGDFSGKIKDISLTLEHNTFEHIGFGVGLNSFSSDVEAENNAFKGKIETSYMGVVVYLKAYY